MWVALLLLAASSALAAGPAPLWNPLGVHGPHAPVQWSYARRSLAGVGPGRHLQQLQTACFQSDLSGVNSSSMLITSETPADGSQGKCCTSFNIKVLVAKLKDGTVLKLEGRYFVAVNSTGGVPPAGNITDAVASHLSSQGLAVSNLDDGNITDIQPNCTSLRGTNLQVKPGYDVNAGADAYDEWVQLEDVQLSSTGLQVRVLKTVTTASACQLSCQNTPSCEAYEFRDPSPEDGSPPPSGATERPCTLFLANSATDTDPQPRLQPADNVVVGYRRPPWCGVPASPGIRVIGKHLNNLNSSETNPGKARLNENSCNCACAQTSLCVAYTYDTETKNCWMHTKLDWATLVAGKQGVINAPNFLVARVTPPSSDSSPIDLKAANCSRSLQPSAGQTIKDVKGTNVTTSARTIPDCNVLCLTNRLCLGYVLTSNDVCLLYTNFTAAPGSEIKGLQIMTRNCTMLSSAQASRDTEANSTSPAPAPVTATPREPLGSVPAGTASPAPPLAVQPPSTGITPTPPTTAPGRDGAPDVSGADEPPTPSAAVPAPQETPTPPVAAAPTPPTSAPDTEPLPAAPTPEPNEVPGSVPSSTPQPAGPPTDSNTSGGQGTDRSVSGGQGVPGSTSSSSATVGVGGDSAGGDDNKKSYIPIVIGVVVGVVVLALLAAALVLAARKRKAYKPVIKGGDGAERSPDSLLKAPTQADSFTASGGAGGVGGAGYGALPASHMSSPAFATGAAEVTVITAGSALAKGLAPPQEQGYTESHLAKSAPVMAPPPASAAQSPPHHTSSYQTPVMSPEPGPTSTLLHSNVHVSSTPPDQRSVGGAASPAQPASDGGSPSSAKGAAGGFFSKMLGWGTARKSPLASVSPAAAQAYDLAADLAAKTGLSPQDPFLRSIASNYRWAASTPADATPLEAGMTTIRGSKDPLPVRLSSQEVNHQLELLPDGLIHAGHSSLVFKGLWPQKFGPDTLLAIKVLRKTQDDYEFPRMSESFSYEAGLLNKCRHANIVRMYGYCLDVPTICIVSELLPWTLEDRMSSQLGASGMSDSTQESISLGSASGPQSTPLFDTSMPLTSRDVVRIAMEITQGLSHIHSRHSKPARRRSLDVLDEETSFKYAEPRGYKLDMESSNKDMEEGTDFEPEPFRGFAHRDLQPHHVLINSAGRAKLIGFGLPPDVEELPSDADVRYVAPELFKGLAATDKADMYSLAMIMWQLISREQPWPSESKDRIWTWVVNGERPYLPNPVFAEPATERKLARTASYVAPAQRVPTQGMYHQMPQLCNLIRQCWNPSPSKRPEATVALKTLLMIQSKMEDEPSAGLSAPRSAQSQT